MSYNLREASTRNGEPLEFIKFATSVDEVYRYTNAIKEIEFNGEIYQPVFLVRSNIAQSNEIESAKLTVTLQRNSPIVKKFALNQVSKKMYVVLYKFHNNDVEVASYWQGSVSAVTRSASTADITCESPEAELDKTTLRQYFQPSCRHFFGDGRCPVPLDAVKVTANVASADLNTFTIQSSTFASKPDGYFSFGFIELGDDVRYILNHVGNTLTLLSNFHINPIGLQVTAYGGCDNLPATCKDKWGAYTDNGEAYGGFYVSIENYFEKGIR